jgi:hypothetical protein
VGVQSEGSMRNSPLAENGVPGGQLSEGKKAVAFLIVLPIVIPNSKKYSSCRSRKGGTIQSVKHFMSKMFSFFRLLSEEKLFCYQIDPIVSMCGYPP